MATSARLWMNLQATFDLAAAEPFGGFAPAGYLAAGSLMVRIWGRESGRSARELVGLRRGDLASIFPAHQPREAVGV